MKKRFSIFDKIVVFIGMLIATPVYALGTDVTSMINATPYKQDSGSYVINIAETSNHVAGKTSYQLPLVSIYYGVGNHIHLKLETPWVFDSGKNGIGNSVIGAKWHFYGYEKDSLQVSVFPQASLGSPSNNSINNGLSNSGTAYLLPINLAHSFINFNISLDAGRWIRPTTLTDTWTSGITVSHDLTQNFELVTKLHDEVSVYNSKEEVILNVGMRWKLDKRQALTLSVGHDLHNTLSIPNTVMTYLGLQTYY